MMTYTLPPINANYAFPPLPTFPTTGNPALDSSTQRFNTPTQPNIFSQSSYQTTGFNPLPPNFMQNSSPLQQGFTPSFGINENRIEQHRGVGHRHHHGLHHHGDNHPHRFNATGNTGIVPPNMGTTPSIFAGFTNNLQAGFGINSPQAMLPPTPPAYGTTGFSADFPPLPVPNTGLPGSTPDNPAIAQYQPGMVPLSPFMGGFNLPPTLPTY